MIKTPLYNMTFDSQTGNMKRWGKTFKDDPEYSPIGPELLDIEISTICNGLGTPCKWCYKNNCREGKNMSSNTFKKLLKKLPPVKQIAFGVGNIWEDNIIPIFEHCRENGIVPNVTTNGYGLTPKIADSLVKLCGAVAVSRYTPKSVCYDAVKLLTDKGLKQVNIHKLVADEEYDNCIETIEDIKNDKRLEKLNAVVFLALKQQGRGKAFHPLQKSKFYTLLDYAFKNKVNIGFDSCSSTKVLQYFHDKGITKYDQLVEPCESCLFSGYINVEGIFFPCSFLEDKFEGINILETEDFLQDVWYEKDVKDWREKLLENKRNCPVYKV
jgi:pyruvate-formate lyase-activating enzyme